MHQAAYDALGLPWLYVPFACESSGLKAALEGMRALSIRGFGVSMPFKIEILPLLNDLAPLAKTIGLKSIQRNCWYVIQHQVGQYRTGCGRHLKS